jgi:hypothetical protein
MKLKRILFPLISVLVGLFLSIIILEMICRVLPVRDSLMTLSVDAENPVMRFKENRDVIWSSRADFSIITKKHVNNYGFLNDQNYSSVDKSPLLAIIGDSFVEAAQVENKDAMHGLLSRDSVGRGRVYSFGTSGSPLSTYLVYANYAVKEFHATELVFIVVGNDFDESLVKYKNAPGFHYFSGEGDDLVLVRKDFHSSFIKRLSRQSSLVRYLALNMELNWQSIENIFVSDTDEAMVEFVGNTRADFDEERITDSRRAVDKFFEELPVQTGLGNDKILFVLDGMRPQIYDPKTRRKANGSYFDLMRKYFMEVAVNKGYEVIDMQPVFIKKHESEGIRFEFPTDGHWNEIGHNLVAGKIKGSAVYNTFLLTKWKPTVPTFTLMDGH